MKKRLVAMLLCIVCSMNLLACGKNNENDRDRGRETPSSTSTSSSSYVPVEPEDPFVDPSDKPVSFQENFLRDENIYGVTVEGQGHDFNKDAKIVEALQQAKPGDNIVFSETSLNMALGLLYEGAEGESFNALEKYLKENHKGDNSFDITKRDNELINTYYNNDLINIYLANSVWTDTSISLLDDYKNRTSMNYNAVAKELDFQKAESAGVINSWCADMTNNCIKEIVTPEILSASKNVLINALYFKAAWSDPFTDSQVRDETFTNADGTTVTVPIMSSWEGTYFENDYATGFAKIYADGRFSYIGILPKNEGEFSLEDLDLDSFMASKTYSYDVHIKLPKHKVEDENILNDMMMSQGLTPIFTDRGEFLKMTDDTSLYVSKVIQKTYIDVSAEGTEAAAVTAVMMTDECAAIEEKEQKEVFLDRAFAFMIYDSANDEVLFIGKVNELN